MQILPQKLSLFCISNVVPGNAPASSSITPGVAGARITPGVAAARITPGVGGARITSGVEIYFSTLRQSLESGGPEATGH